MGAVLGKTLQNCQEGQRMCISCLMLCYIFKEFFALWDYGYSFHHFCGVMSSSFSDMCRIMGTILISEWHVPVQS